MKVLATYSIKGGVGKTTAAINLAHEAAATGARVLIWDLDPQGAATYLARVRPTIKGGAERLARDRDTLATAIRATDDLAIHLVPADFSLRHLDLHLHDGPHPTRRLAALLERVADRYDVVLIDCAAGITLTSEAVFATADALLVPVIPTTLSQRTLEQLDAFLTGRTASPHVLPFASMVDHRKALHREILRQLACDVAGFLPTAIPDTAIVERMGTQRGPVAAYAARSAAAVACRRLWTDIADRIWP